MDNSNPEQCDISIIHDLGLRTGYSAICPVGAAFCEIIERLSLLLPIG